MNLEQAEQELITKKQQPPTKSDTESASTINWQRCVKCNRWSWRTEYCINCCMKELE